MWWSEVYQLSKINVKDDIVAFASSCVAKEVVLVEGETFLAALVAN